MMLTLISVSFIILCRMISLTNAFDHYIYLVDDSFYPQTLNANVGDTVRRNTLMRSLTVKSRILNINANIMLS